jgi:hypothetical protein
MECVQVGSISYLRDTVNHQNKMQTRLDYEMMANPVELVGRRGEEQKARDSFVAEDSKDVHDKHQQARKDTSFEMGSLPSSDDSDRHSSDLKNDDLIDSAGVHKEIHHSAKIRGIGDDVD